MSAKKPTKASKATKSQKYRLYSGDEVIFDCPVRDDGTQATDIERKAKTEANRIGQPVRVVRGTLAGDKFTEEFSTMINPEGWKPEEMPAAASKTKKAGAKESKAPDTPKAAKPAKEPKAKKVSALDAAAKVLVEQGKPMNCPELIEEMSRKKYWTSPNGATPHATLYAAIAREIKVKGKDARFVKADRGKFAAK